MARLRRADADRAAIEEALRRALPAERGVVVAWALVIDIADAATGDRVLWTESSEGLTTWNRDCMLMHVVERDDWEDQDDDGDGG